MKKQFISKGILFILIISGLSTSYAQDNKEVKAWFLGSHGFLLESPGKKVALDAIIYWEGYNYGYIKPPLAVKEKIEAAMSPFDSLDLILISHAHIDHFNSSMVEKSMSKNPKAVLVTTPEVYTIIKTQAPGITAYTDRIWIPKLKFYTSKDTLINGISLSITDIPHSTENMNLFVFSFTLENTRFLQLNSWNSITAQMYDTLGFNKTRADVTFLCYDYLLNASKFELYKNNINSRFSAICHIDGASISRINQLQTIIQQNKANYPMSLLSIPMEGFVFKKTSDTILVDTLNTAPKFIETLKDTIIRPNVLFSYIIPEQSYTDIEGGPLKMSIALSNGNPLPEWLKFNESTHKLEGTPESTGVFNVSISVIDSNLAVQSDVFKISVESTDDISNIGNELIRVYPVPAQNKIFIDFKSIEKQQVNISLINMNGSILQSIEGTDSNFLDISNLSCGVYFIRVNTQSKSFYKKIIKQ